MYNDRFVHNDYCMHKREAWNMRIGLILAVKPSYNAEGSYYQPLDIKVDNLQNMNICTSTCTVMPLLYPLTLFHGTPFSGQDPSVVDHSVTRPSQERRRKTFAPPMLICTYTQCGQGDVGTCMCVLCVRSLLSFPFYIL